jgi:ubiquinone/menaquinone biosynthesis C-methylase UbiE
MYLSEVETGPGARVLDVSVGTGADLRFCPRDAAYFGVDISPGMLRRCQRNLRRWRMEAELFRALAEALPFRDETFDAVFHAGGINYFSDKSTAVREMVRVARPGAKIAIVDATERLSRAYEKVPIARRFVQERGDVMAPPVEAVPTGMEEVRLAEVCSGELYCLTFRKPV